MRRQRLALFICALVLIAGSAAPAEAQRHHHHRTVGPVIIHSPLLYRYGHPFYLGFAQWYPYPWGVPPFGIHPGDHVVTLRLQISPRDAVVYVDGYAAGIVDDYDGVFQRLRLIPGHHEIVVFQRGYRTLRQALYFNPGSSHTIKHTLIPLGPGEIEEPQPAPRAVPPLAPPGGAPPGPDAPGNVRLGTLSLRVQPFDAAVSIDGETWRSPQGQERLVVQLSEGVHRLRVEKPGLQPFTTDVDVRAGETTNLNVSLSQ